MQDVRPPTLDDEVVELEPARPRRLLAVTFHGVPGTANVTRSATTKAWMHQVREQARGLNTHWERGMRFWARNSGVKAGRIITPLRRSKSHPFAHREPAHRAEP